MSNCKPCKAEGRTQAAHPIVTENGETVHKCKWHYEGISHPADRHKPKPEPTQVQEEQKETPAMPRRIDFDEDKLRQLHAQGLTDHEIGKQMECSGSMVHKKRTYLNLPANGFWEGKQR